jgi:hypothetical protein
MLTKTAGVLLGLSIIMAFGFSVGTLHGMPTAQVQQSQHGHGEVQQTQHGHEEVQQSQHGHGEAAGAASGSLEPPTAKAIPSAIPNAIQERGLQQDAAEQLEPHPRALAPNHQFESTLAKYRNAINGIEESGPTVGQEQRSVDVGTAVATPKVEHPGSAVHNSLLHNDRFGAGTEGWAAWYHQKRGI